MRNRDGKCYAKDIRAGSLQRFLLEFFVPIAYVDSIKAGVRHPIPYVDLMNVGSLNAGEDLSDVLEMRLG